jgi:hypothetical protein
MSFNDRQKGFENKFSMDQQSMFKVEARASKLIGLWAAEKMGLAGDAAEAYAKEVISANLDEPGFDDVKRKIQIDFSEKKIAYDVMEIDAIIEHKFAEAAKQVDAEKK